MKKHVAVQILYLHTFLPMHNLFHTQKIKMWILFNFYSKELFLFSGNNLFYSASFHVCLFFC